MKPSLHLDGIDLGAIVAPFQAAGPGLHVGIEDVDGRHLAGASHVAPDDKVISADILANGAVVARVRVSGVGAASPLAHATAIALARALSAAAERGGVADDPVRRILDEELAHGRRLQRSFVSLVPPAVDGYDLATHYEAAREIGGDFFDLFRLRRRGRPLSLVIADVTGKGVAAALLMAFSRPLIHAAIDHVDDPAEALERTNTILFGERRTSLFITALCARLDVRSGSLRMANAGHEPPLIIPADGSPVGYLLGSGPLIGAFPRLGLPEVEVALGPGDVILFYTDGVTDARAPSGERLGEEGLLAAVERARGGRANDYVDELRSAVTAVTGGGEPADDVTIVALGRRGPSR
jgi:sigma-B regulation protein RsbU (phosphoserine phosphatase)